MKYLLKMGVLIVKKQLIKKVEKIRKIERIRDYMHDLINEKGSLTDPDVILASQLLDLNLNEYNKSVR